MYLFGYSFITCGIWFLLPFSTIFIKVAWFSLTFWMNDNRFLDKILNRSIYMTYNLAFLFWFLISEVQQIIRDSAWKYCAFDQESKEKHIVFFMFDLPLCQPIRWLSGPWVLNFLAKMILSIACLPDEINSRYLGIRLLMCYLLLVCCSNMFSFGQ